MATELTQATNHLAEEINRLHKEAEQFRDEAVGRAYYACQAAIQCGEMLNTAKEANPGQFLEWLQESCPDIQERTARNYMRAAKHRKLLSDDEPDFKTLKELYVAAGIMPEPPASTPQSPEGKPPDWVRLTSKMEKIIPKLSADEKSRLRQWASNLLAQL